LVVLGVLSLIAGILALLNPFPASLAAVRLASWAFLIFGALQIIDAFSATGWGGKLWSLVLGVVAFLVGIDLLTEPLAGLIKLTMVLGALFLVSGAFKLIVGWRVHRSDVKAAVILSGLASLLIGIIILSNFPASAATSLGIILGIELISNGVSAIALGWSSASGALARG
jgi:membrane protein HdeD